MTLIEHLNYCDDLSLMNEYINNIKNHKKSEVAQNNCQQVSSVNHIQKVHLNIKKYYHEHDLKKRISQTFEDVYHL
ncbi:hypothetical protein H8356DRAFT_1710670 [Neocallimastix lanati (nom. inval.)]|uniref:Uncharacterized protein n=1 Tax=Neocallimastix californiae TaxID=1754190 RepID=A0A1Y2AP06_9FUNG|nr:hypothetical protein H8356DRAFT_1710670 [Neocallimastix sp. JGI-2020a]ORY24328.1 hypothetical protein LY90DRAFT_706592 [Neocallimastix californiae]|eukprot:ORY24328.1 hypothetical protein LY90DRAFT_706592 [Neocallimastix californiae]